MRIFIGVAILVLVSCSGKQPASIGDTPFQIKMNADFKDASKSPLKSKDLKSFKGLDFFPFDDTYVVNAQLERTPNSEWFNMRTTTDRLSKERIFGVLSFQLKGKSYALNIYQGEENMTTEGLEDYLFLPFLDDTNGESTYGGGRYIDLRIPKGEKMEIDFNKAYNPYCVYNEKFSCPIVPRSNYLDLKVEAGVKMFVKE
ncbi:DUF1684 domain-containing protein [Winogradskyella sp. DF17]|uniref:DUF1684 domain-containing protein n=1 Tax=Winogradskyella pelagia TaxID=2819984 RepID=A0ABS3T0I9_9FLAO|nr:DUF1684 domain-containing protein [Winogradskyella sp. DF17]MBO3116253.1 DUF1684 domain-containing protein [Winogradskyella sp. DF17]